MSSGHGSGPEDPQETPTPADPSSQDDENVDWASWRQGEGYSRPMPPEPEAGSAVPKPGSHEKPPPRHPYQDRVPNQAHTSSEGEVSERGDDFWAPKRSGQTPPASAGGYPTPPQEAHEEPRSYQPPRSAPEPRPAPETGVYQPPSRGAFSGGTSYPAPRSPSEPSAYQAPSPYEEPSTYEVPKPRPYVGPGNYDPLGRRDEPAGPDEPPGFDEPPSFSEQPGFDEPLDNRPDDADSGPRSQDEKDEYARFWGEGRGGGAHASPAGGPRTPIPPPPAPVTPVPPPPGDTSIYRNPPPKRQLGLLITVAVVVVLAAVVATLLLTRHSPKHHPAASGSTSPGASHAPSAPVSTPPSATGASGHLGVPGTVGSLRLNSGLTSKFVGASARKQDANSFLIQDSDVVSGFYTTDPAAASFSAREPRLMFLVAYLAGSGNAHSALHEFMTNHTFTGQQQINPGSKGGVAACGLLPQKNASPVAHCMWADGDTYADFYGWNSSTSALAKTMIGIRPKVELSHP